ncbi:PREDICTED: uncharacterized protein LOC104806284 [Tarenaya hassleriana]|uniref:uncharacterized protein LOC104806284 n=1 Tax=Tarenaya hassleriana TaxID=28532 RepID=UPI00053C9779|nr:PREDICTED: uncharacterized protein LOC104806284 [Tarenaya hassleriana]
MATLKLRRCDLQPCPFIFFFVVVFLFPTSVTSLAAGFIPHSVASPRISYSDYCNDLVPESPVDPSPSALFRDSSLRFNIGFFSGGESLFSDQNLTLSGFSRSARFVPFSLRRTLGDGDKVFKIEARLDLLLVASTTQSFTDRKQVGYREGPRFEFSGLWSESTGHVCMVGSGGYGFAQGDRRSYDVVLKLNYSKDSNIHGSLINGVLQIVKGKNTQNYFKPISILGVRNNLQNYEYTLLGQGRSECGANRQESLSLQRVGRSLCSVFSSAVPHTFGLRYETCCNDTNPSCSAFGNGVEYLPDSMTIYMKLCDGDKMHMLLSFRNSSGWDTTTFTFDPDTTLLAEGAWDPEKNRFCGVACRISNFSAGHAAVDDCSSRLSLSFPAVLSIRSMAPVIGQLWSVKPFSRIELSSIREPLRRFPELRFKYTEIERVEKLCGSKRKVSRKVKGKHHYPDPESVDMIFHMSMKSEGDTRISSGSATPLFVDDHLFRSFWMHDGRRGGRTGIDTKHDNVVNSFTSVSYRFQFPPVWNPAGDIFVTRGREIYAEGRYDRETGELCMVGCQSLSLENREARGNDSTDCSIVINIKFSLIESKGDRRLNGTIESLREKADPLYFGRIELFSRSIYARTAEESVWRMDLEIIMVLISNTLSCIFVGLQLYHMKKHPEVQSFISIAMAMILTLGHMIPLLLNFEAMFKSNRNPQNTFFENDGWLEAKEIVVRMVTMVAFLLELRVLFLSWTARKIESRGEWDAEKKVFFICLPIYVTGGLIAWLVNRNRRPEATILFRKPYSRHLLYRPYNLKRSFQRPSLWKDLRSFGGLILDGFLLPQILFNVFRNSDAKSLAVPFYVGTSLVRLLPHSYDLYRSRSYGRSLDWSFIYANHKVDYYSTAWNVVIQCFGFLFGVLIFLQQRFGGRCFLPRRFRENCVYEKVPNTGSVELHQTQF